MVNFDQVQETAKNNPNLAKNRVIFIFTFTKISSSKKYIFRQSADFPLNFPHFEEFLAQ